MQGIRNNVQSFSDYKIHEYTFRFEGNIVLLFFTASIVDQIDGKKVVVPMKLLDVFRRERGKWIQAASCTGLVANWQEMAELYRTGKSRIRTLTDSTKL